MSPTTMPHTVTETLDALAEQTMQRGGCPSVRDISNANLNVAQVRAAYSQLREELATLGFSDSVAVRQMDRAVERL